MPYLGLYSHAAKHYERVLELAEKETAAEQEGAHVRKFPSPDTAKMLIIMGLHHSAILHGKLRTTYR